MRAGRRACRAAALLLAVGLVPVPGAHGADLFVDGANGSDALDGLSWATAKASVSAALDAAAATPEPDVVSVAAGRYGGFYEVPGGVHLLGGFPPGGGPRDPRTNVTTLDGRGQGPVVRFGPGTDDGLLDGFTVTGGAADATWPGSGVTLVDSGATIRGCVIEGNAGCNGVATYVLAEDHEPAPRIVDTVMRGNVASCASGFFPGAGAAVVLKVGWNRPTAPIVMERCRVEGNAGIGVHAKGRLSLHHLVVAGNTLSGLAIWLRNEPDEIALFDCEITENGGHGVRAQCEPYVVESCTIAGNAEGAWESVQQSGTADVWFATLEARHLVVDQTEDLFRAWSGCIWETQPVVEDSLVVGGLPFGTGILDADPEFVSGPASRYLLAQVAAGQAATSPAVDAASVGAASVGLETRSTRTDGVVDAGLLDFGAHHVSDPLLDVWRGLRPDALAGVAAGVTLPWTDEPGLLHDAARPLLFYRVRWPSVAVKVSKEPVTDSLTISF